MVTPGAKVSAALLYIDLFSNTSATNDSGTTALTPYGMVENEPVAFHIASNGSINATILPGGGKKYVLLQVPSEMVGHVTVNAIEIQTTISVPITGLLGALTGLVTTIINNPLLGAVLRGSLTNALNNLLSFENFGETTFAIPATWATDELIIGEIDSQLGPILATELRARLIALRNVINTLPLGAILLSGALNEITRLVTAIDSGTLVSELAETAILGNTQATIHTEITSPAVNASAYEAQFLGGIIWSSGVPTNDSASHLRPTSVFFNYGELLWKTASLPDNLNFGSHPLQTRADENWIATIDGEQNSLQQTGQLIIQDSTLTSNSWQLNVTQTSNWENQATSLTAELSLHYGMLTSDFSPETLQTATGIMTLEPAIQQTILDKSTNSQYGQVVLDIDQFTLFVPKDTYKKEGQYVTELNWTLSQGP